ncbi:MAG: hypothetical protein ACK4RK_21465 [Gemmataceae bacterium]
MTRRTRSRWWYGLGLGILLLGDWPVAAQSPLPASAVPSANATSRRLPTTTANEEIPRVSYHLAGDSRAIVLHADSIASWTQGGRRILLLRGKVLVEHGVIHIRAQQAVAWVDEDQLQRQQLLRLEIYAEGEVRLDNGPDQRRCSQAVIDISTRGELKVRSQVTPLIQEPRTNEPVFQRAAEILFAEKNPGAAALTPDPALRTASFQQPGAGTPSAGGPSQPTLMPPVLEQTPPPRVVPTQQPGPPGAILGPPPGETLAPMPRPVNPPPPPPGPPRILSIAPRTGPNFQTQIIQLPTGEQAIIVTGGVILSVRNIEQVDILDIEADRLVFWTKDNTAQVFNNMKGAGGQTSRDLEFYLAGNVEIRQKSGPDMVTLRAEEVFYDVGRSVAVAVQADLEYLQPGLPYPVHFKADEILQVSPSKFKAVHAEFFASKLPSDPGVRVMVAQGTLQQVKVPKRNIFGRPKVDPLTGEPQTEIQRLFQGESVVLRLRELPVFYWPYVQGDANNPLGPVEDIQIGGNRIFGFQLGLTLNAYDLLGLDPNPGTRWTFDLDYMSRRGPGLGTDYVYGGNDLFNIPSRYTGVFKAWGLYDDGTDILGGPRDNLPHPLWRGRVLFRQNWFELPYGFSMQNQLSLLSDKNFLEQYYKQEFDTGINQETFTYLKQQNHNWAWTGLLEPRLRDFVTETEWLPRVDGYWIGQSFFNIFTYTTHASAGYAQLRPTNIPPPPVVPTDVRIDTGRFDWWHELSIPFTLGPFRLAPYGVVDLTYYSNTLTGNDQGRFYGAGGVRGSLPLTRLYPGVESEFLNLNGINHKMVFAANYYIADTNTVYSTLPQLDRLNDDATDQAIRDITPLQPLLNPAHGAFILANTTDPFGLFNPQFYAIRRLVDNRIDTLDSINVLQMNLRQRLQTKRGYPGRQHIIDWMTLDLSASYFPNKNRDNFGEDFAFIQYDWVWNIGDRTALTSAGWFDPIDDGARVWNVGAFLNRPDRTQFYLGYRHTDPLESRLATAAVTYACSAKYALTGSISYDFGINENQITTLTVTRMGTDLQLSLGVTYNALMNNFGVLLEVQPNLATNTRRVPGVPPFGSSQLGAR